MSARKPPANGRRGSTDIGRRSKRSIKRPSPELQKLLKGAFDQWVSIKEPARRKEYRQDFVFHMTDWLNDLDELAGLYRHPDKHTWNDAGDVIFGFFMHALNHLNAAARIFLGKIDDPFAELYPPEPENSDT